MENIIPSDRADERQLKMSYGRSKITVPVDTPISTIDEVGSIMGKYNPIVEERQLKMSFGHSEIITPLDTPISQIEDMASIMDEYNPDNDTLSFGFSDGMVKLNIGKNINPFKFFGFCAVGFGLWYGCKLAYHCGEKLFDEWRDKQKAKQKAKVEKEDKNSGSDNATTATPQKSTTASTVSNWLDRFNIIYSRPEFPEIVENILDGVPKGQEQASILHILTAITTYCFSGVRSKFVDSNATLHSPSLQVIIYAPSGQGKDKLRLLLKHYFSRIIERDQKKFNKMAIRKDKISYPRSIVQSIGIGISKSRLYDILAENSGVCCLLFDSEIRSLVDDRKNSKSAFQPELFRHAYDRSSIFVDKNVKGAAKGYISSAINYSLTGVAEDVHEYIPAKGIAGGDANRIAICTITGSGQDELILLENEELDKIQNQFDEWQASYSYYTKDGEDIPCDNHVIELDYVCKAILQWENLQIQERGIGDGDNRKGTIRRIGCTAFHFSMCLHMMWGEPDDSSPEEQGKVIAATIYIANLCIEGYCNFFENGYITNTIGKASIQSATDSASTSTGKSPHEMSEDELLKTWKISGDIAAAYYLRNFKDPQTGQNKYGWKTLHKEYPPIPESTLRSQVKKYEESL